jgi:FMN-dependent NADH-azoreductase
VARWLAAHPGARVIERDLANDPVPHLTAEVFAGFNAQRYTENGPEGLLSGKEAYVFAARGGVYADASETETSYVRQFLSFLGITDIEFVYAEGLALGDAARTAAFESAARAIEELTDASRLVA